MANEITGELIRSAVAQAIIKAIPSAKGKVYKEAQTQNITTDAFYITQRKVTQKAGLKDITERDYNIIVRYEPLPNTPKSLEKCGDVANNLMFGLRSIDPKTSDKRVIWGHDMNYSIVDDIMQLYVTYTLRIIEREDLNPMQLIEIERKVY